MFDAEDGLTKIMQLEPEFERTGEPRVRYIDPRDTGLRQHKYASAGALDFIRTVEPLPGHRVVLVLAMSAWEFYGPNRNGDGFSEREVILPGVNYGKPVIVYDETLPQHHKSFESTAHNFLHHVNKDPAKAVGRVIKSFYNWPMHRVELLLAVDEQKAPSICRRIMDGEYPGVSMGCRIKYDVCTICGNRAPTRAQYCEHVNGKNPMYGMNTILPDGRQCAVLNPSPLLFDISWVWRPADRVGFMMKKVASAAPYELLSADIGAKVALANAKTSALHKLSLMDKFVEGDIKTLDHDTSSCGCSPHEMRSIEETHRRLMPGLARGFEPLSDRVIDAGAQHGLKAFTSSLASIGIRPTVSETYRVVCRRTGHSPADKIQRLLPMLQSILLEVFGDTPGFFDEFEHAVLPEENSINVDIVEAALPHTEKRALYKDYLLRRYVPEEHAYVAPLLGQSEELYYRPTHQTFDVRDPQSGRSYQTTRQTAELTDWENTKRNLAEAGILSAGAGLGFTLLSLLGRGKGRITPAATLAKWTRWPVAGAGALGAYQAAKGTVPTVPTAQGVPIPFNTPMAEKRSSMQTLQALKHLASDSYVGPLAGGGLAALMLGSDRFLQGMPPEMKSFAREHPILATGAGALGLGALRNAMKRRAYGVKLSSVSVGDDAVSVGPVDVGSIVEKLATAWAPIISAATDCG
jgi:hypothetical protein